MTRIDELFAAYAERYMALDADGALLRELSTSYHLLRAGDSWRILSYTSHDS